MRTFGFGFIAVISAYPALSTRNAFGLTLEIIYINRKSVNIISVSYEKLDDDKGRHHKYHFRYLDMKFLRGIVSDNWEKYGEKQYRQTNEHGVLFRLHPTMNGN